MQILGILNFLTFLFIYLFYAVNKAYQFSSITSVTLLDCWTVAWVLVLTWIVLRTRYSKWQIFGAVICVTGLGLVLLSDAGVGGGGHFLFHFSTTPLSILRAL